MHFTPTLVPSANLKLIVYFNISSLSQASNIPLSLCRAEFDSHADTCGVNDIAKILSYTGKVVQVSAYSPKIEKLEDIPVVSAALAYDDSLTGETLSSLSIKHYILDSTWKIYC